VKRGSGIGDQESGIGDPGSSYVGAGFSRPYSPTLLVPIFAIAIVTLLSPALLGQQGLRRTPGAVYDIDFPGKKSGPPPRRDISGIWEFANGGGEGIQADGAKAMPSDGKPEHELPFTTEGRKAFQANKPTFGFTQVPSALTNDPMPGCDPQGFPRIVLHNAHHEQIIQTATQVVILYQFNKKWRSIWTDGRKLPSNPEVPAWDIKGSPPAEARFWGYSVGRWVDDYTFVADSNGFDDRSPCGCGSPGKDNHDRRPEVLHAAVGRARQTSIQAAVAQPRNSRAGVCALGDSEIQPAVCESGGEIVPSSCQLRPALPSCDAELLRPASRLLPFH